MPSSCARLMRPATKSRPAANRSAYVERPAKSGFSKSVAPRNAARPAVSPLTGYSWPCISVADCFRTPPAEKSTNGCQVRVSTTSRLNFSFANWPINCRCSAKLHDSQLTG